MPCGLLSPGNRLDGRYGLGAVKFVYEGLSYTAKKVANEPRHVSGQTLSDGLRQFAIERWGRLAMLALGSWGVHTTRDFGEIVYMLIDNKWMSAQPGDHIDHFNNVYEFETVFKREFLFAV